MEYEQKFIDDGSIIAKICNQMAVSRWRPILMTMLPSGKGVIVLFERAKKEVGGTR